MYLFSLEGEKEKLDGEQDFIDFMARVRTQSLAQRAMRNAVKDVQATEEEAQKFYDEHKDQFTQPERIHARHILISDDATSADTIARVQADLKAGASFDEEAKKLSTCPSAPQGGDLGEFTKEQMVPEFSDAAFAYYRELITHPDFVGYFLQTSPINEIASLNIGSRPASRQNPSPRGRGATIITVIAQQCRPGSRRPSQIQANAGLAIHILLIPGKPGRPGHYLEPQPPRPQELPPHQRKHV